MAMAPGWGRPCLLPAPGQVISALPKRSTGRGSRRWFLFIFLKTKNSSTHASHGKWECRTQKVKTSTPTRPAFVSAVKSPEQHAACPSPGLVPSPVSPLTSNLACPNPPPVYICMLSWCPIPGVSWNPLLPMVEAGWLGLRGPTSPTELTRDKGWGLRAPPGLGSQRHGRLGHREGSAPWLGRSLDRTRGRTKECCVGKKAMSPGRSSPFWASLLIPDKVVGPCGSHAPPFLGVSFPKNQQCLSGTPEGRWLAF